MNIESNDSLPISPDWRPETVTVQAGRPVRNPGAPMNPPVTLSSTYIHTSDRGYGRDGNSGWAALETALGELDGGTAVTFASGLAAATAIADLVPAGGTVVLPNASYYGVKNIFQRLEAHGRLTTRIVDANKTNEVISALDGAAMVWMESVANPLMVVTDISAIIGEAKKRGITTVVDSTFVSPLRQRPLELGADIVLHSATKVISGHSDLLLGAAICASKDHAAFLVTHRHDHGAIPGALEAYLALRGLRTLSVRLDRAESNALELAKRLKSHPLISKVNYPGLPDDSQYEKSKRLLPDGSGNMLSFELKTTPEKTDEILSKLRLISHATSLGGVESKIERRTRYAGDIAAGVPMTLCRFSVGIENVEDQWQDLEQALRSITS